jgi:hypothetical protein
LVNSCHSLPGVTDTEPGIIEESFSFWSRKLFISNECWQVMAMPVIHCGYSSGHSGHAAMLTDLTQLLCALINQGMEWLGKMCRLLGRAGSRDSERRKRNQRIQAKAYKTTT